MIWEPLQTYVDDKTILVSPSDSIARLPFHALPGSKEGSFLIEEHAIAVIPYPRFLPQLLRRERSTLQPSMYAVGNVNYGNLRGKSIQAQQLPWAEPIGSTPEDFKRYREKLRLYQQGELTTQLRLRFEPLPSTGEEVDLVVRSFRDRFPQGSVIVGSGASATDLELHRQAQSTTFLHLATHGYFLPAFKPPPHE